MKRLVPLLALALLAASGCRFRCEDASTDKPAEVVPVKSQLPIAAQVSVDYERVAEDVKGPNARPWFARGAHGSKAIIEAAQAHPETVLEERGKLSAERIARLLVNGGVFQDVDARPSGHEAARAELLCHHKVMVVPEGRGTGQWTVFLTGFILPPVMLGWLPYVERPPAFELESELSVVYRGRAYGHWKATGKVKVEFEAACGSSKAIDEACDMAELHNERALVAQLVADAATQTQLRDAVPAGPVVPAAEEKPPVAAAPAPRPAETPPPPPAQTAVATAAGDTYVLAVGVNAYDDTRIPKLRFAEEDARSVYGFFATSRRSPTSQDRVHVLVGKEATRNNILKGIREHLERKATRAEDTVILYFAGHGFSDADDTYLAGSDARLDSLRETALSSATLRDYWSKIRAGRKLLILDACHSGGFENMRGTRGVGGIRIGDETPSEGGTPATPTVVIAATGPNELSTEDPNIGQGVFTRVLVNGLSGEADADNDGRVTAEELGRYLVREVPGVARGFGGNQTPVVRSTGSSGPAIVLTR